MTSQHSAGRRFILKALALGGLTGGAFLLRPQRRPIAKAAPLVKHGEIWSGQQFTEFLHALPQDAILDIKKSLGISENATEPGSKNRESDVLEIKKELLWISSNVLTYPFKKHKNIDYHELVTWTCKKAGVSSALIHKCATFQLEHELYKLFFAELWDKLNEKQRADLLLKIDPNGAIKNKAGLAALGGAGALAALSAAVSFSGFAFYTTMSVTIHAVASAVGVTLPFATYAGASTLVGVLSGPVGWAIIGLAALGGLALAGQADVQKTTAFLCQIHALKIEALVEAGVDEKKIF